MCRLIQGFWLLTLTAVKPLIHSGYFYPGGCSDTSFAAAWTSALHLISSPGTLASLERREPHYAPAGISVWHMGP